MQKYWIIAALLLIVGSFALVQTTRAESEPNDTFNQDIPIGIGYDNGEVGATLTEDDEDYYRFEAVADRTYVIETYNIDGTGTRATGLWLYNESEAEIANDRYGDNGTGNVNARIIFSPTSDGTYFIGIRRAYVGTWTGTYSLRVLPQYDEPGAAWGPDGEPDDVIPLANAIELGRAGAQTQAISANRDRVSNGTDRDFYRFDAVAGREYVIETFDVEEDTGGNGTGLYLYNEGGNTLANDAYGDNEAGERDAQITFTFANPGTYFVMIAPEPYSSWSGSYSIRGCEESCAERLYLPLVRR